MSNPTTIIRNYHSEDFNKLVQLGNEVQERARAVCLISSLDLIESVGQFNHFSKNNLFIAERAGEMIGYADVRPESNIGRVVLRWLVHPKHRRKKIAEKFVERAIFRAKELGIMRIHVNILQNNLMAKQLLTKMGFTFIRRFLELRLELSRTHLQEIKNIAAQYRPLRSGEVERLTRLQNRSFMGSWGYNVNTFEEMNYRIHLPNCTPKDIILAFDSDRPIGYCWTRINLQKNRASSESMGRIYMLGVDPDYRGRGIGKQLLLRGLSYLRNKGLRVVELTMDRGNQAAYALYKSVGFKLWTSTLWYEKKLD